MNPAEIIERAAEDGVLLALSPSRNIFAKGERSVIDRWLPIILQSKAGIVLLLRPGANNGWSAGDWRAFYDERASIAEFDGGLPRSEAEARAFTSCVAAWLNRNPDHSPPERCLGCGGGERTGDTLLPFGVESTGHAWLHSRCWPEWRARREAKAVAAFAAMGIASPPEFPDDFGKNGGA
jgi:hypothetical protein